MNKLIELFKEYFKPYETIPCVGLTRNFILKNGYNDLDIETLMLDNIIEEDLNGGYRMTNRYLKEYCGSSYKHVPEWIINSYKK